MPAGASCSAPESRKWSFTLAAGLGGTNIGNTGFGRSVGYDYQPIWLIRVRIIAL